MQLNIKFTSQFKKDYKRCKKRNYNISTLESVITLLIQNKELPNKYRDHFLIGNYNGRRECHLAPDWLLIYKIENDTIFLERTGSHSDLFK